MSDILEKLQSDHEHIRRLLSMFAEQVQLIHKGENPDAPLMQDIMGYMTHYPTMIHHPLEDLMFEHMARIDDQTRVVLQSLTREHDALAHAGHDLKMCIDCLESEVLVRRDVLDKLSTNYIELMHRHLKDEEGFAFPLARELLTDADWEKIRAEFKVKDHEVFGNALDSQYETLYQSITGLAS